MSPTPSVYDSDPVRRPAPGSASFARSACPFCSLSDSEVVLSNREAVAFYDRYPVSPGHVLIIPRRHVAGFFEATPEEFRAMTELLHEARVLLDRERHPDGYNIGINVGEAAGQTVFHLHMHLIPRYSGDMEDPAGGVRHVIPEKGKYRREDASDERG